jgi:Domain of unknown function (DUF4292)
MKKSVRDKSGARPRNHRRGILSGRRRLRNTACFLLFIGGLLIFASACRSTKKIEKAITNSRKDTTKVVVMEDDPKADSIRFIENVFSKMKRNTIDFKTFSAKLKVNYEGSDGRGYEFTAFLRILKDSIIWVRGDAILGIEAFRALITRDSVKILDKMDKSILFRSVSYLQEVAKVPMNFKVLQNLLIGNPIYMDYQDSNVVFYRNEEAGISLLTVGELFKNYITLNRNDYTLKHVKLDDVDVMRARTCDVTYRDYEPRDTLHFSTYRKVSLAEKSKFDIEISFKQYNFNEVLSFPFPIPKNYKHK